MSETIEIQKQLGQTGGGIADTLFGQRSATPLAGFGRRALAFAIDIALLYALATLWFPAMRELFLDRPLLLPTFNATIVILYFTLLNGPLGRGRTAGKYVMGIATLGLDGRPLGLASALARSVTQCLPLPAAVVEGLIYQASENGPHEAGWAMVATGAVSVPTLALFLANVALPVFKHDRRGVHEAVSGSVTLRFDAAQENVAAAVESCRALPAAIVRRDWLVAGAALVVLLGTFEYLRLAPYFKEQDNWRFVEELRQEFGVEGMRVIPGLARVGAPAAAGATADGLTTAPMATDTATSGNCALLIQYSRLGRIDDATLNQTIAADNLTTAVARWLAGRWLRNELPPGMASLRKQAADQGIVCDRVEVRFVEFLALPWFPGISHLRQAWQETFPLEESGEWRAERGA